MSKHPNPIVVSRLNVYRIMQAMTVVDHFVENIIMEISCTNSYRCHHYVHIILGTIILLLFQQYLDHLRNDNVMLSSFWRSCLDMVDITPGLLRSSREGDFTIRIASIMALIQWCFTYNRLNYAQYIPFY